LRAFEQFLGTVPFFFDGFGGQYLSDVFWIIAKIVRTLDFVKIPMLLS